MNTISNITRTISIFCTAIMMTLVTACGVEKVNASELASQDVSASESTSENVVKIGDMVEGIWYSCDEDGNYFEMTPDALDDGYVPYTYIIDYDYTEANIVDAFLGKSTGERVILDGYNYGIDRITPSGEYDISAWTPLSEKENRSPIVISMPFSKGEKHTLDDGTVYYISKSSSEEHDEGAVIKGKNAFIYLTEGSGSTDISVKDITYRASEGSDRKTLYVVIREDSPSIGTCDMAYWTIRIPLKEKVDAISFETEETIDGKDPKEYAKKLIPIEKEPVEEPVKEPAKEQIVIGDLLVTTNKLWISFDKPFGGDIIYEIEQLSGGKFELLDRDYAYQTLVLQRTMTEEELSALKDEISKIDGASATYCAVPYSGEEQERDSDEHDFIEMTDETVERDKEIIKALESAGSEIVPAGEQAKDMEERNKAYRAVFEKATEYIESGDILEADYVEGTATDVYILFPDGLEYMYMIYVEGYK